MQSISCIGIITKLLPKCMNSVELCSQLDENTSRNTVGYRMQRNAPNSIYQITYYGNDTIFLRHL